MTNPVPEYLRPRPQNKYTEAGEQANNLLNGGAGGGTSGDGGIPSYSTDLNSKLNLELPGYGMTVGAVRDKILASQFDNPVQYNALLKRYGINPKNADSTIGTALQKKLENLAMSNFDGTLNEWIDENGPLAREDSDGRRSAYNGPVTSTNINLSSPSGAERLLDDSLGNYLGRAATKQEKDAFFKALTSAQVAEPAVSTRTPQGVAAVTTVGSTGLDEVEFAKDFAMSQDDYAETQANTTLMDWFGKSISNMEQERIVAD